MSSALFVVGFVVEAVGLTLTAIGLWRTWKANTDGNEPMWPWLRRCRDFLLYTVLRRERPPVLAVGNAVIGHMTSSGTAYTHQPLTDEMTVDQKIVAVQANALSALKSASDAHAAVTHEETERKRALSGIEERISGTEAELRAYATRLVVDGVPMAIGGLAVTGLGLLIQTAGNLL